MKYLKPTFESIINTLILFAFVVLVTFVVKQEFFAKKVPSFDTTTISDKVPLASEYLKNNQKSVILVLQTTCHFCNGSMSFYKRLIDLSKGKDIHYLAVFPEPVEESTRHLNKYGIIGMTVNQAEIDEFHASGTPTLIIANDKGVIERAWVGKLTPKQELEVFERLNL